MRIIESFLTENPCYKQGKKLDVKGLMLHSVGCPQQSAAPIVKSWNRADYSRACVHAFIDGSNGDVYQTLPWDMRGWHCGKAANNTHIGVEMCEPACIRYTSGATFTCDDLGEARAMVKRTYEAAVDLFADLCRKYGLNPLTDIISHSEGAKKGIASNHADPEHLWKGLGMPYTMDTFRQAVSTKLVGDVKEPGTMSEADIYVFFKDRGMTDAGVSGLMGNLYAESCLKSTNLQNVYERKLGMDDEAYTAAVDSGSYQNFIQDKAGYGLAQWTFWTRKQALLDYARGKGVSIGDARMQCEFLMEELQKNFPAVLKVLMSATTVREASDAVLLWFEKPADQSLAMCMKREGYGKKYYDKYASGGSLPYRVRVTIPDLNVRKGPGRLFGKNGVTGIGVFTITEEKNGWGKLKSGAGWICLSYTQRI